MRRNSNGVTINNFPVHAIICLEKLEKTLDSLLDDEENEIIKQRMD